MGIAIEEIEGFYRFGTESHNHLLSAGEDGFTIAELDAARDDLIVEFPEQQDEIMRLADRLRRRAH